MKNVLKILLLCLPVLCFSQQSKVDSAIMYLNKSFATNKLDSSSRSMVDTLLNGVLLTDNQIIQIENTLSTFKNWNNKPIFYRVRGNVLRSLIKSNADKAISYGKLQIVQLDKINTPEASSIKSQYLSALRFPFRNSNRLEQGFQYYTSKLNEYKIKNDSICIAECHFVLGGFSRISGLLDLAIYNMKKSISYIDSSKNQGKWNNNLSVLGYYFYLKGNPQECISFYRKANNYYLKQRARFSVPSITIADAMLMLHQLDSANYFISLAKSDIAIGPQELVHILQAEANLNIQLGTYEKAEHILRQCWQLIEKNNIQVNAAAGTIAPDYLFAQLRIKQSKFQEAIDFLKHDIIRLLNNRIDILRDYRLIAELYTKMGNGNKAAEAYAIFLAKQDSLLIDQEKYRSISFEAEQQMNEKERSIANLEGQNKIASLSRNFLIGITALLLLLAGVIYQRFRFKKAANHALEKTLHDLKSTQSQLVQSEKMASLGELTAGIAHEIQNPLNFVNNFSELNVELVEELRVKNEELGMKNEDINDLVSDIQSNSQKINHHGQRAAAIVKGMLQHSRTSSGQKELTDINALCDEYLRLAYHGLRAKDKSFNAQFETNFDENLPKINVVPQDMSRVVLNIINNAFFATAERSRSEAKNRQDVRSSDRQNGDDVPTFRRSDESYTPLVTVSTKTLGNTIEITIADNGTGIPDSVKEKIFQPFFTTKPTGQGTGLGLSLAYDIVTKVHSGKLTVESERGKSTTFKIEIPI